MTVLANVLVYLVAWAILNRSSNNMICPDDAYAFRNLMLVCISIGAAASIGYHLLVKFPNALGNIKVLISILGIPLRGLLRRFARALGFEVVAQI